MISGQQSKSEKRNNIEDYCQALETPFDAPQLALGYRLGVLIAAVTMVLLPIAYLVLIALVGYGVWQHLLHDWFFITQASGRGIFWGLVIYLAPAIAGVIAIIFMVKPFLARVPQASEPMVLDEEEHADLYRFVDKLADCVGAPKPCAIHVDVQANASASFHRGFWGFLTNDLVLTLGLPLVGAMNLRQLTGVMAHEFGHFTQGSAMRLTYIIRSIQHWFARIVYERDQWDVWLENSINAAPFFAWKLCLYFAKFMVWVSRKVLWLMMLIGNVVCCFMLRQMEYDADRFETHISGSECFRDTCHKLPQIAIGKMIATNRLSDSLSEKRIGQDMVALAIHEMNSLTKVQREGILKDLTARKAAWWDTHPDDNQRIAAAQKLQAPGIFTFDDPATVLFPNFTDLCSRASERVYKYMLGDTYEQYQLVDTQQLVQESTQSRQANAAATRFFQNALRGELPMRIDAAVIKPLPDVKAAVKQIEELRKRMVENSSRAAIAGWKFSTAADDTAMIMTAMEVARLGGKIPTSKLSLNSSKKPALEERLEEVADELDQKREEFDQFVRQAERRLFLSLRLASSLKLSEQKANQYRQEIARYVRGYLALYERHVDVVRMKNDLATLLAIIGTAGKDDENVKLKKRGLEMLVSLAAELSQQQEAFAGERYPYTRAQKLDLGHFLVPQIPVDPRDIGVTIDVVSEFLSRYFDLIVRLQVDLAAIAVRLEARAGMKPLPEPKEVAVPDQIGLFGRITDAFH